MSNFGEFGLDNSRLRRDAEEARNLLNSVGRTAEKGAVSMDSAFKNMGSSFAAIGGTTVIGMLGKQILDTTAKFEKFGIVLRNTLGEKIGNESLSMIAEFAATTPFQLDEVTGAFIKMANQGFVPTKNELVKLGDLASSTGKSFDQLGEALLDAQTGQFERLKEFGIKASKNGDKVTFTFKDQQTTVDNTNKSIQAYLLSLGTLNGIQGANAKISQSLTGQISNLDDKLAAMYNTIGTANSGLLYTIVGAGSTIIENYETIGKVLMVMVGTYGSYQAAILLTNAYSTVQNTLAVYDIATKNLQVGATIKAAWAQTALNKAILANPYIAVGAAIVLLVGIMWALSDSTTAAERAQTALNDRLKENTENANKERSEAEKNINAIKSETTTRTEKQRALQTLQTLYPDIFKNLNIEKVKNMELADAIRMVNSELEKKAGKKSVADIATIDNMLKSNNENFDVDGAKAFLGDKASIMDSRNSLRNKLEAERATLVGIQKQEAALKKAADFDAMSSKRKIEYLKDENANLAAQKELLKTNGELGKIPIENIEKQISKNNVAIAGYEKTPEEKKVVKSPTQIKADAKAATQASKDAARDLADFKKSQLDQQKTADAEEIAYQKTLISDKESLIMYELSLKLKAIEEERRLSEEEAKKTGGKYDGKVFEDRKTTATNQANTDVAQLAKDNADALLEIAKNYQDERKRIETEANIEIAKLRKGGFETEAKAAELQRDTKISTLTSGLIEETDAYKLATGEQLLVSKETTARLIADIKKRIEAAQIDPDKSKRLSKADADRMLANLDKAEYTVKKTDNPFTDLINGLEVYKKALEAASKSNTDTDIANFAKLEDAANQAQKSSLEAAAGALQGIGAIISQVTGYMDELHLSSEADKKTAKEVMGMISGAVTLAQGLATGNPITIIQGSIELMVNAYKLLDVEQKKIDKKIEYNKNQIDALIKAYDQLGEAIKNAYSTDKIKLLDDELVNLKEQKRVIEESKAAEEAKTRNPKWYEYISPVALIANALSQTDPEEIKKYNDALDEIAKKERENADARIEALTGTSVSSAIDEFANAYADAFYTGEDAALKSADIVKNILKKALVEDLKKDLQPGIVALMDMVNAAMSDGVLTAQEKIDIETEKKKLDLKASQDQQAYKDLGFGTEANRTASAKGFATMSQGSADELNGRFTAMQGHTFAISEGMKILQANSSQALNHLAGIETNTSRLVAIEKGISDINTKGIFIKV